MVPPSVRAKQIWSVRHQIVDPNVWLALNVSFDLAVSIKNAVIHAPEHADKTQVSLLARSIWD